MGGPGIRVAVAGPISLDGFASKQARDSKLERGLIVTFALAELLVAGGEPRRDSRLLNPTSKPQRDRQDRAGDAA